ncbi:hypothetical protein [Campylobacter lanienae]|nr:hypothetical protein [Campylobacter lanienae]
MGYAWAGCIGCAVVCDGYVWWVVERWSVVGVIAVRFVCGWRGG